MKDWRSWSWQYILLIAVVLIVASMFLVFGYGTAAENAAVVYGNFVLWWATFLIVIKKFVFERKLGKDTDTPFGFSEPIPGYAIPFSFMLVPLVFFLAEGMAYITTGQLDTTALVPAVASSIIPEVLTKFVHFDVLPNSLGQAGVVLQEFAWELGQVGPGEEFFKVGVIGAILAAAIVASASLRNSARKGTVSFSIFVVIVLTSVDGLWTVMHSFLSYSTLTEFATAFLAGWVFLMATWYFENLIPAIIGHGLWNFMGLMNLLNWFNMFLLLSLAAVLTGLLFLMSRKGSR